MQKGANWDSHCGHWDVRFDHNHLRITRIIRSLRVLGLENEAQAFYGALQQTTRRVSTRSREYWRRAAERTLNLRPDLEDGQIDNDNDLSVGPKFLREFEELQKHIAESKKANDNVDARTAADVDVGGEMAENGDASKGANDMTGARITKTNMEENKVTKFAIKDASAEGKE